MSPFFPLEKVKHDSILESKVFFHWKCTKLWLLSVNQILLISKAKMENDCLTEITKSGHSPVESLEPNPSYLSTI